MFAVFSRARKAAILGVTLLAGAVLAACDTMSIGGGPSIDTSKPVPVALLVPKGSAQPGDAVLAQSLESAARLAIGDLQGVKIDLRVYDTAGNAATASTAASQAVSDGARIILGPVYAEAANAAGLAVRGKNINVLSFSNNPSIAGGNVFVLGPTFANTAQRLATYAAGQGKRNIVVVYSNDLAGTAGRDAFQAAASRAGARIAGAVPFEQSQQSVIASVPRIRDAVNGNGADALFLTANTAGALPLLSQLLPEAGVSPTAVQFIGLTRWDIPPQTLELPGVQGGWFALPDPSKAAQFNARYTAAYGAAPHPIGGLAYDGIAAIGALVGAGKADALTGAALTQAAGFQGVGGIFRLLPDGTNQRGLAVATVQNRQVVVIDPAPTSFAGAGFKPAAPSSEALICAPEEIFDTARVAAALDKAASGKIDPVRLRNETVRILREANAAGRDAIAAAFEKAPFESRALTHSYAWLTDCLVIEALRVARTYMHPQPKPSAGERLAVIAVGGYGRGEMAPFSDVDLLFLTPTKITAWAESVIEAMLYILWDLRLKVGHASRTVRDCIRLGLEDYTIRTALLEHRFLTGDAALAAELARKIKADLFANDARDFVAAKLSERDRRHEKQGQRYMVEPNVKEGKGGLRDLQSLFWIAKCIHGVTDVAELVPLGVFSQSEFARFQRAEAFLWAVRSHMHLLAGRAVEQLTFDLQVEVAERLGYQDKAGRRAVEVFMQDYFRHATAVGDLTRIFLTKLEAIHVKSGPLLDRIFRRKRPVKPGYVVIHNRLAIADPVAFLKDKLNLLRLFDEALRTGMLIHPDAMRLVTANLDLIDDEMRADREAASIFLGLLLKHGNPERALRRMNELGMLSAFLPEFEPIVAMMQFNMYHSYTVDEHIIQCIKNLAQIEKGELRESLPVASGILAEGVNRKILYVALLLHDIGKGRPEDHSILGAQIARRVAPRLGLSKAEAETVEWLVRYHLLMSDMAQKRDIADPRTVRDFAKAVQTVKRLDLLTVLTVCDIRGVGPNTWNNWKAALIRALYRQTRRALKTGMEDLNRENHGTAAKRALREALSDWPKSALKTETGRHYAPYWQGLHVTAHVDFARLLRDLEADYDPAKVLIHLHPDEDRDATRACFVMTDHPGIFARLAGALALVGANVVDARSYTTKDGYVTDAFWIQDADGKPYEANKLPRLAQMIQKTLKGEVKARDALKSRDKIKKREKAFTVPTHITFDNEGSDTYTIIEVDTRDRPGLLYDLARTLAASNVYIANAVIATYGEQVVDAFYVKDMFGLKYYSESKQRSLEAKLRKAIDEGAERARG